MSKSEKENSCYSGRQRRENLSDVVFSYGVNNVLFELTYDNAEGYGKMGSLFNDAYQSGNYDYVLAMYDTDNFPKNGGYQKIQEDLMLIFGSKRMVDLHSLCTTPNTAQLFLAESENPNIAGQYLGTGGKRSYSEQLNIVFPGCASKKSYDARDYQLVLIKNAFLDTERYSYERMRNNIRKLPSDIRKKHDMASTTVSWFLDGLVSKETKWLDKRDKKIMVR